MTQSAAAIDFWFDFTSPYGYLMAEKIDEVAARHGREVRWRPFLLGVVLKLLGTQPLTTIPMKGPYSVHDLARSARFLDVPFKLPSPFPVGTQQAARAYYHLAASDPVLAREFARAVYRAFFVAGDDITAPAVLIGIAARLGVEADGLAAALADDAVKAQLKAACDEAIARGVFGSPYVVIDGEPFWGVDRLPQIERWLERGGF